jgi:uncharacterized damage-inducible protein DinB
MMISPDDLKSMTAYNAAMNERLYAAAARLPESDRQRDRGAFWRSIHGTFNHLLWADLSWMARFDGWSRPAPSLQESGTLFADFAELAAARTDADKRMKAWAERVDDCWLSQDQAWVSGAGAGAFKRPRALLLMHLFNHQTHHRGQVHAMLTAAGETTGDTDLWLVLQEP